MGNIHTECLASSWMLRGKILLTFSVMWTYKHHSSDLGPMLFPCILILCLLLLNDTVSCSSHLLMTYNYRCLLLLTRYPSYFTLQACKNDVKALATAKLLELIDIKAELMLITKKN